LSFDVLLSEAGRGFEIGLSLAPPGTRSAGRGDGLGELPFGLEDLSDSESTRATLAPAGRISSSAFRFGNAVLGRDAGVEGADGFSPVMDAIKSRIGIVTDAPWRRNLITTICVDPPQPHTKYFRQGIENQQN
jgi:hypothetical protein